MKTQFRKIALLGLVLAFIGNVSFAQRNDNDDDDDRDFHLDQTYNMDATGTLHLSSSDADVRIVGSNRSDVHVKIDRSVESRGINRTRRFDVEVETRSGDLYITERRGRGSSFSMGYYRVDYDILVELPEGASLRIKGDDDDYYVKNVNGKIDMDVDDGDIELEDCKGNDFQFDMEDGDLRMEGGQGKVYVRIDDGDVDIQNGKFEDVEMVVEDGSIIIETELFDKGSYEIRADDARIDFIVLGGGGDFMVTKDDGRVRSTSAFETIRETDYRSELKLDGGKADVQIRTNDGSVRLSTR